ncbi:peptidyl-prolyl cis-trans isomerase F, mitochondrial [Nilaparvata lugens]|uniref:peptidyl-prolyl cis-trans isomerase F, mitochondrial n=1 Tax=Nilaparvata lugens TaxID=108931 RepID=UPI00193CBD6E|nr:peptidyl-prolyl cis-trans isomerase F, mitochondrial [Nilaparvata lugens]
MSPEKISVAKYLREPYGKETKKVMKKIDNGAPFFYPSFYFSSSKLGDAMARMKTIMMMNKQLMIKINTVYRTTRFIDDSRIMSKKLKKAIEVKRKDREVRMEIIAKENEKVLNRIRGAKSSYNQESLQRTRNIKLKSASPLSKMKNYDRWSILPEGEPSVPSRRVTCFFDITIDKIKRGRLLFEIYCDIVPRTAERFISLCDSEFFPTYRKAKMHQVFSGFFCLGGELNNFLEENNKRMGYFPDENHVLEHAGPGVISMFNSVQNKNNTKFLITFKKLTTLNGRFVVFGRLKNKKSLHVLEMIEEFGTKSGCPKEGNYNF